MLVTDLAMTLQKRMPHNYRAIRSAWLRGEIDVDTYIDELRECLSDYCLPRMLATCRVQLNEEIRVAA